MEGLKVQHTKRKKDWKVMSVGIVEIACLLLNHPKKKIDLIIGKKKGEV